MRAGSYGRLPPYLFGVLARMQIGPRGNSRNLWVAVAMLVVAVAIVYPGVVRYLGSAQRDDAGRVISSGSVQITGMHVGDCVDGLVLGGTQTSVTATPCGQPHEAEVVDRTAGPSGDWPGVDAVREGAFSTCDAQIAQKVLGGPLADRLVSVVFFPHDEAAWIRGDPITCLAVDKDGGKLTGPVGS
ncbi:hypothetical protein GCM10023194_39940 [Planotetraspora phitsanulokensis]|uniref:Septum formation-related domain-containing protein n=1 Tax=Planotetraspora phitsanulokensis TaxID=575192 RepID=A0A8J3XM85_9ACTN|nr:hypothetical protein Pph01_64810 [Planotetraspora phitsanulokensis]